MGNTTAMLAINVYTGPPDLIIHDTRTNLTVREFKQNIISLLIQIKKVLVKVHNSIREVKYYYKPLY